MNIIEEQKNEVWRDIPNFRMYQVSNLGRVKRKTHEKFHSGNKRLVFYPEQIMKQSRDKNGYLIITLKGELAKKTLRVHRLVAFAFIPNPNNYEAVNHLNENKQDNRVENLMWASAKENANWGTRNKRIADNISKPVICGNVKYPSIKDCANVFGINYFTMYHWLNGSRKMPKKFLQLGLKLVEVE